MFGLLNSTAAAGHVSATLVASEIVAWSFVPAASAPDRCRTDRVGEETRRVTFPRAIELLFAAHAPWSLWLVPRRSYQTIRPDPYIVIGSGVVPLAITAFMLGPSAGRCWA